MAYDEDLAERLGEQLADEPGISTKRMFGGHAFLSEGHMVVSASGRGGLLVRIDPDETAAALARPYVSRMVMGGREMDGWLLVAAAGVEDDAALAGWVEQALSFVRTLPPK
ncbi:MAG: hypothetical protein QOF76_611 [Solirubrobacteraceae bacterium]|jgi:TfoX/Sxy family transcriptional regulator of competence genes|nr:hypothetical protein [Solirubrobacteraceae bacterium]